MGLRQVFATAPGGMDRRRKPEVISCTVLRTTIALSIQIKPLQELTEGTSEIPKDLEFYIDYERMGRDMEYSGDVFTIETAHDEVHVFWNH